jgi:hypothetical protein
VGTKADDQPLALQAFERALGGDVLRVADPAGFIRIGLDLINSGRQSSTYR